MNLLLPYLIEYYYKHLYCKSEEVREDQETRVQGRNIRKTVNVNCSCDVCTEYRDLKALHNLKKNKSIKSFVKLWAVERVRLISEDFILFKS